MSVLNKILSSFLGSKAERDLREIKPYVDKINAVYPEIAGLSNDELRIRSSEIKKKVKGYIKADDKKMYTVRNEIR